MVYHEYGRIVRGIYYNEQKKYDSSMPMYSLFMERGNLIKEQPESIYFMDKFLQPTHLFVHSNMHDYPTTAKKENITDPKDWKQTVVTYEPFRIPVFIPHFLQ